MQYMVNNFEPSNWQPVKDSSARHGYNDTKSIGGGGGENSDTLSTLHVLLIALGVCLLVIAIIVIGIIALWRCGRRQGYHDKSGSNGATNSSLFSYSRPEIVITEPTIDVDAGSRRSSYLEMYSSTTTKSVTQVPTRQPCSMAILEDLDETELISPACVLVGNNHANSARHAELREILADYTHDPETRYRAKSYGSGSKLQDQIPTLPSDSARHDLDVDSPHSPDRPAIQHSGRTQSISSIKTEERPSYVYSAQSPYGFSSYGIGEGRKTAGSPLQAHEFADVAAEQQHQSLYSPALISHGRFSIHEDAVEERHN